MPKYIIATKNQFEWHHKQYYKYLSQTYDNLIEDKFDWGDKTLSVSTFVFENPTETLLDDLKSMHFDIAERTKRPKI